MAIVRVQGNARGTNSGNTISITMGSTPTNGNVIVLGYGCASDISRTISSISQTNVAWTAKKTYANASSVAEIWTGIVSASAATGITVNLSGAPDYGAVANVCEYSGLNTADLLDKTAQNFGASSTHPDTGTTDATTQADELWVGCTSCAGWQNAQSSPTNGFSLLDGVVFNWSVSVAFLEKIVSGTGTANCSTTVTDSEQWIGVIATFKAEAAASGQQLYTLINMEDY
jgi:hypothetical protein